MDSSFLAFSTYYVMEGKTQLYVENGGTIMTMITTVDQSGIVEKTIFMDANGNVIN